MSDVLTLVCTTVVVFAVQQVLYWLLSLCKTKYKNKRKNKR